MNGQDINLPEFTYEDYLRDMSEYFMLQTYKTGNMPTIKFSEYDDINPTTVPDVNDNTITIKIPREVNKQEAYNEIIQHCYNGVQLQIGNNSVTTVKIDPQPYSDKDIKTECYRSNFETDKENYHKAIKDPDGNNFKLTVYGYSPEKNTQTVPVNGTPDTDKNEQEKVPNIDLLTGAFLQYMYSGFQNFPEYVDDIDDDNIDEMYLHTLLNIIRINNTYNLQNIQGENNIPPINTQNMITLYKTYLADGVDPTTSLLNISKLYMTARTLGPNQDLKENTTLYAAGALTDMNSTYKHFFQNCLRDIDPDKTDTRTQLDIAYETCEKVRDYIESRELTNGNKGGINLGAFRPASAKYKLVPPIKAPISGINPAYCYSNSTNFAPPPQPALIQYNGNSFTPDVNYQASVNIIPVPDTINQSKFNFNGTNQYKNLQIRNPFIKKNNVNYKYQPNKFQNNNSDAMSQDSKNITPQNIPIQNIDISTLNVSQINANTTKRAQPNTVKASDHQFNYGSNSFIVPSEGSNVIQTIENIRAENAFKDKLVKMLNPNYCNNLVEVNNANSQLGIVDPSVISTNPNAV